MQKCFFWSFGFLLSACGDAQKETDLGDDSTTDPIEDPIEDPTNDNTERTLEEIRVAEYAADLGTFYNV